MEISGAVLRRSLIGPGTGFSKETGNCFFGSSVACARRRVGVSARPLGVPAGGRGFSDEAHLQYLLPPVRCGLKRKEEKKRARLVKGLSKDLSAFYSMGFGVDGGEGLAGEVKGKMVAEAADVLLAQLKQLKEREKELKRKKKRDKAAMRAARMKDCADDDTSSSSSSESSDSDCEAVVGMSTLRAAHRTEPKPGSNQAPLSLEPGSEERIEETHIAPKPGSECSSSSSSTLGCSKNSGEIVGKKAMDRIEVCLGGKCRKSGASELLAEFKREVGAGGAAVVGCKCMGKCRDGPIVRVLNRGDDDDDNDNKGSLRSSRNPLCIGVGLEDVGAIVASLFGGKDVGLLAA